MLRPTSLRRSRLAAIAAATLAASVLPQVHALAATSATPAATNGVIAFQREVPAGNHTQTDLYVVRPDGTGLGQLTDTPNRNEFGPAWGPAGARLAFWRTAAPFGTGSLWLISDAGLRRLTVGVDARDPSWNPAGTRLVYDLAVDDLYTLRVSDGQDRQPLTSGPALDFEPAWSPDGTTVAFTRGRSTGDPGDIYLVDVATHAVTRVTHAPSYDHQVAWGPLGHRLVFERDLGDRSSIFTVRRDGTGLRQLTTGVAFDVGPTYSPDGQFIAFGSDRGSTLGRLWVMDSDGANQHELLALKYSSGFPSWQSAPS